MNPPPPKPPADAPLGICPQCGKANSWTENDKYRHSLLCRPADALPDVKAICARLEHARKAFKFDGIVIWDSTLTEAITALERLAGEVAAASNVRVAHVAMLAQLETSLRSSEAALAEARRLHGELRGWCNSELGAFESVMAELTALRANAGEDGRRLDWLENEFAFVRLESEDEASVPYWIVYVPDGKDGEYGELARGITPREAIDAASRPETKGDNE